MGSSPLPAQPRKEASGAAGWCRLIEECSSSLLDDHTKVFRQKGRSFPSENLLTSFGIQDVQSVDRNLRFLT